MILIELFKKWCRFCPEYNWQDNCIIQTAGPHEHKRFVAGKGYYDGVGYAPWDVRRRVGGRSQQRDSCSWRVEAGGRRRVGGSCRVGQDRVDTANHSAHNWPVHWKLKKINKKCEFLVGLIVCPGISDPFYTVTCYIKWVTTSWTDGTHRGSAWRCVAVIL